jgi:hypothetical protein
VFTVTITSPTDSSRDDVLAAVQGSGITVVNFTSVDTVVQPDTSGKLGHVLQWTFQVTDSLSNLKNTVAQFTALQNAIAQKNNGMSVSFAIVGTQASAQALAAQNCAAADLIADARTQARKMTAAAGLSVGAIIAVSALSVASPAGALFAPVTYYPVCSLTVKFALTGF